MREIRASEAKTHLPQLYDAIGRGETIVIIRHGRAIARLVPEVCQRQAEIKSAIETIKRLRRSMPKLSPSEIKSLIGDGRATHCAACHM
jgi:antitoxin (DNA-binding transcriptional repressor) of toxin-antitoxin stability system